MSDTLDLNTPVAGETVTTPEAPASSGAPVAQPTIPAVSQPPATGGVPEGYVPSYRIREAREAAFRHAQNEFSRKEAEYNAKMQQLENNLRALVGVQPPQNPEIHAVRDQFGRVFPNLSKLEEQYEKIATLLERVPDFEAQTEHYWTAHAAQTMDKLFNLAQESLGTALSDEGKRNLQASFIGFLQSSPELTERYQYDPTVVTDFWKAFTSNFIEPVKRSSAAQTISRAPKNLPQDTPSGNSITGGPAKAKNLDERADQAWAAFKAMRKGQLPSDE